jgi:uncharacterized membrane protein
MQQRERKLSNKQFLILIGLGCLDGLWAYLPGMLFLIFVAPLGSINGALGQGVGLLLGVAIAVLLIRLWAPTAMKISRPLIQRVIKRIGVSIKEK